ncbi:MAG: 50S ribosomal protein L10 [Verrucomicrobia bacterium]|nr:50S ribosomal protein L10 [Verrucomicrobiota bacterium]MBI3868950.1 50S ribosomal protein L10 [Verrucomicrobiota bacterium]
MRAEKKYISAEYAARLGSSPYFYVVDYQGLRVAPLSELRKRLRGVGAEIHIVKNSIFRIAAKDAGVADLGAALIGQTAVVTGQKDAAAAAKILKKFVAEFERPKMKFGFLGNHRMEAAEINVLAELPSLDVLRGKLLGLLNTPATNLVRILNTPATQLAQVIKAKSEKA